jgi:hypothetical protein
MIEVWLVDEKGDPATFPLWLAVAVTTQFEGGMFVLTSNDKVVEARPGDLVLWDGQNIRVLIDQQIYGRPEAGA